FGGEDFVLLSSLDETIVQHGQSFNLALHRFPGSYEPRGHKYLVDFNYTPSPTMTYRVGGVLLRKELLWVHSAEQLLIRYTLLEAHSRTLLRLRPFLAFRSRHTLSKSNFDADTRAYPVDGGVRSKLYEGFPWLSMQTSRKAAFVAAPQWYDDFEYAEEANRGYPSHEDLLTTGYFELELKAGQSVVFSASTSGEVKTKELGALFVAEQGRRTVKTEFLSALRHSARQFLINFDGGTMLNAGYPWYNPRSRETFMALAGCTLTQGLNDTCKEVLDHHVLRLSNGLFGHHLAADTQLWFFHTLQQWEQVAGAASLWKEYGRAMKEILWTYRHGETPEGCIRMAENGLIWASMATKALTWMNVNIDGVPLTRRPGFVVEINALWYNAVCYTLKLAIENGDKEFVQDWEWLPEHIAKNFVETFWLEERRYLADYVYEGYQSFDIRPNQLLACSLGYSPLSEVQRGLVVDCVRGHLLTTRGVRTLSPRNPNYKGSYSGDQCARDSALHQGTAFPWLLEHYVKANFDLRGGAFIMDAEDLLAAFAEDVLSYGIGSAAEVYDGDPPYRPAGAISFAPSVGALLNIEQMIQKMKIINK
ncbi:MAG: amylo-alpha-1,6-glucosidase, partial [Mucinivorans sp.]